MLKFLLRHKKVLAYTGFTFCLAFLFLIVPETGFAEPLTSTANPQDVDLVRCGGPDDLDENGKQKMCKIEDLFDLIVRVMQWGFRLGVALATLMFAYAGLLLMSSLGKPTQISKAKGIFLRSAIGIIIMFVAYSAIWFILTQLGVEQSFYQFF
jgi:hypothetical protein